MCEDNYWAPQLRVAAEEVKQNTGFCVVCFEIKRKY